MLGIQGITFQSVADSIWEVPKPIRRELANVLFNFSDTDTTTLHFKYGLERQGPEDNNPIENDIILIEFNNNTAYQFARLIMGEISWYQTETTIDTWLNLPAALDIEPYSVSPTLPVVLQLLDNANNGTAYWDISLNSTNATLGGFSVLFF